MKTTLKRVLICAALCGAASLSLPASAQGIPVIDAASLANAVQELVQLQQQYTVMQQQYSQLQSQYQSLTGVRGFGDLMNNPALRSYLPSNWQQVFDAVKSGGFQNLTKDAQTIRNASAIYNCSSQTGTALGVCQSQALLPSQNQAYTQEAYTTALGRVNDLQSLINQIDTTNDPKGIAELQARINGEGVAVQNEQVKLQLYKMLADAQTNIVQQQQREMSLQQTGNRGRTATTLTPLTF